MRSVEEVRSRILGSVRQTGTETVNLEQAVGRILAEPVVAAHDVPSFTNSAMDGYAVRAADVATPGAVLDVLEGVAAGATTTTPVGEGQAIKIMTGAPLPEGTDSVVRVEDTVESDGKVEIAVAVAPGTSVRAPGGDVAAGSTVFAAGTRVTPAHIGVLATIGVTSPKVARRPLVAVMSTGDELVPADTAELPIGKIRDSNRPMVLAMLSEAGAVPVDMGRVPDVSDVLRSALGEAAATSDAIVTSGGVSMGDHDVIKEVLRAETGVEFYPVAMKPGKPQGFGAVGGKPFFGLPGNPVSVFVSFEQFVRPALLAMQGAAFVLRPRVTGIAGETLLSDPAKEEFVRARIAEQGPPPRVVKTGGQGSHVLSGAANADVFAVLGVGVERVEEGEEVVLELFRASESRRAADA